MGRSGDSSKKQLPLNSSRVNIKKKNNNHQDENKEADDFLTLNSRIPEEQEGGSIQFTYSPDDKESFIKANHGLSASNRIKDLGNSLAFLELSRNWPQALLQMAKKAMAGSVPLSRVFYFDNNHSLKKPISLDITLVKTGDQNLLFIYRLENPPRNFHKQLNPSKIELSQLQDKIPIGIYQLNSSGKLIYLNQWMTKLLGYSSKEAAYGLSFRETFEDPDLFDQLMATIVNEGHIQDTEVRIIKNDKQKLWAVFNARQTSGTPDQDLVIDGYLYDISARKIALEQLKASEQMFKAISENTNNGLYLYGEDMQFLYCNPALTEITGYSEKELLGMKVYDLVHPDYNKMVRQRAEKRIAGKKPPTNYEIKIITKKGDEKWVEIVGSQLRLKNEFVVLGSAMDISERIHSIEAIKEREQNYKSLYSFIRLMADNVPDMIWAKDLNNAYIFANKAVTEKLFNTSDTAFPEGLTDRDYIKQEQARKHALKEWHTLGELSYKTDNLVLKEKKAMQFDESGFIKGKYISTNIHKSPLFNEAGKLIGTVGSARDVTVQRELEQKQAHDVKLKNLIYRISKAVNTTKDLNEFLMVLRMELSRVIDTTNMYIALYNKEDDTLSLPYFADEKDRFVSFPARKTMTHFLMLNDKPMLLHKAEIKAFADKGEIELTGSLPQIWLGVPLKANNETLGAIVLQNYHDENAFNPDSLELVSMISATVSISINQKKADDALRESEFALRQIIDNVPVMIFAKDSDQRLVLVNHAFANAYGKQVFEIEGNKQSLFHPIEKEMNTFIKDEKAVIFEGQHIYDKEEVFTDYKGNEHVLQTSKIPLPTGGNKGTLMLGVAMDITERKRAEIELKNAKEKAEGSDRLKTAFLANMSHEIRTPMNAIIGFSELLNDTDLTYEGRQEFIRLINNNSRELLNLLEDIIDVAKIEANQLKVIHSTCKVNIILSELQKTYHDLLSGNPLKNIRLLFKQAIPDTNFAIISDPLRFKQIMNNLIGNAIKFTEEGEVEFGYTIENEKEIVFYVKDTGIGLAPDKLSLIFERFRQAEESSTKEYGGTGLGLTISRRLAEMLEGKMWVESELHKGSSFYFSLPYKIAAGSSPSQPVQEAHDKQDWAEKTIIVAEDENSNFELLKACLYNTKVKLIRAINGKIAVDLMKEHKKVDLILMDMRMPVMNGYDATRIIKADYPDLPIISLTAYAMAEDKQKVMEAGCNDYISKPFNQADLIQMISKYLYA